MPLLDPLLTVHPFTGALRQVTPDLLAEVYLAPRAAPLDISELVGDGHWAWGESYLAAPRETAAAVETALFELVAAVADMDAALADPAGLPPESRAARHLGQLGDLWRAAGGGVPEALGPLRHALSCRPEDALDALPVLEAGPHPGWTQADRALLELLRQHHGPVAPQTAADELARLPGVRPAGLGPLGTLQSGLLEGLAIDGANLRLFGLRDAAAEAEFAAALAQDMLERGTVDAARDIAILLPGETAYVTGVAAAFERVGIPLSGLPGANDRDIGGEALRHLLSVLRPGASPTARASLMVSPFMPWDRATGVALARQAMGNRVPADPDSRGKTLLGLLKPPVKTTTELAERLRALAGVLDPPLAPRLHALAAGLAGDGGEVPWRVLLDAARPNGGGLTDGARTVEGVTVLRADRAPWRAARQLIVLGLAGDRYPTSPGVSPFFLDGEIAAIRASCGIHMRSRADRLAERMELMRRQLSVASDGIVGLVPRRDMSGARLHPAPLVTLLARCLTGGNSEALIEDVPGDPAEWPFAGEPVSPAAPRPPRPRLPPPSMRANSPPMQKWCATPLASLSRWWR